MKATSNSFLKKVAAIAKKWGASKDSSADEQENSAEGSTEEAEDDDSDESAEVEDSEETDAGAETTEEETDESSETESAQALGELASAMHGFMQNMDARMARLEGDHEDEVAAAAASRTASQGVPKGSMPAPKKGANAGDEPKTMAEFMEALAGFDKADQRSAYYDKHSSKFFGVGQ